MAGLITQKNPLMEYVPVNKDTSNGRQNVDFVSCVGVKRASKVSQETLLRQCSTFERWGDYNSVSSTPLRCNTFGVCVKLSIKRLLTITRLFRSHFQAANV